MTKTQEQTLEILKTLVEKQKKAIGKKDAEISKLHDLVYTDENLEERLIKLEKKIDKLEELEHCDCEIDCGIGKIHYKKPNNLQLQLLMEALESAIKTQGSNFVLEALNIIS